MFEQIYYWYLNYSKWHKEIAETMDDLKDIWHLIQIPKN